MIKKRMISILVLCILIMQAFSPIALAAESTPAEPRYNNTINTTANASISSKGVLTIALGFTGIKNVTRRATIVTYVEKQQLFGLYWTRVDIGEIDNQWVDYVLGYQHEGTHTIELSSRGTYRVTVKFMIYGTGGDPDEITSQSTHAY